MKRYFYLKDCYYITWEDLLENNKNERNPWSVYLRIVLMVKELMDVKLQELPIYKTIKFNNEPWAHTWEKEVTAEVFVNNYRKNIEQKVNIFKGYWKENEIKNNRLKELIESVIITTVPVKGIHINLFTKEELELLRTGEEKIEGNQRNEGLEELSNKFVNKDLLNSNGSSSNSLSFFSQSNWNSLVSLKQMLVFVDTVESLYIDNPLWVEKEIEISWDYILVRYKLSYETVNNENNNKRVNNIQKRLIDDYYKKVIKNRYLGEEARVKIYKEDFNEDYFNTIYEIEREFKRPYNTREAEDFEMKFRFFSNRNNLRDFCLNILQYNYD